MLSSLIADVRYSLRSLARQRGFAIVAVLSLALGIGANTAVFSALHSLLFRPLPVRDIDRAVIVFHGSRDRTDRGTSYPAFLLYSARQDTFADVMALGGPRPVALVEGGRRDEIQAELISAAAFRMADIRFHLGRGWTDDADRASAPAPVTVISERFWRERLGSNPDVVGRSLNLNNHAFIVAGVADKQFTGLLTDVVPDLWIPVAAWTHAAGEPARLTSDEHWLTTVARLKDGVSVEQAAAAMKVAGQPLHHSPDEHTRVRPASDKLAEIPTDLWAAAVAAFALPLLVLTLACTNVANLLLARAAARQREMSIRMALGASRRRLLQMWVIDSLLVSLAAGALGLLAAIWMLNAAVGIQVPVEIGESGSGTLSVGFELDPAVMAFSVALSVATALALGLVAGLQRTRPDARRFAPGLNLRSGIIALQMALASSLLIPCGMLVRSAVAGATADPGFDATDVLLLPISARQGGERVRKPENFDVDIAARVAALPGVEAATVMDPVPLWFGGNNAHFNAEGRAPERIGFARVAPRYFATLRMPLLAGRDFEAADTSTSPRVAILNETLARRWFGGAAAVGQFIRDGDARVQVIGVAKDAKYRALADSSIPHIYLPITQEPSSNVTLSLAVRTTLPGASISPAIEREVRALVPEWPAFNFRRLDEGVQLQRALPRAGASILGVLGALGLLLAAIGIYGVLAYVVRQRTQEIGIRLALGAQLRDVIRLIVRQGMAVCIAGGLAGTGVALVASWFLASILYGVGPADPVTFTVVPTVLAGVALFACWLPARQAARVNVLTAIKGD